MSYESTTCPCGGKKERETMICDLCKQAIIAANPNDLALCEDHRIPVATRRAMAIRILAIARRRGKAKDLSRRMKDVRPCDCKECTDTKAFDAKPQAEKNEYYKAMLKKSAEYRQSIKESVQC